MSWSGVHDGCPYHGDATDGSKGRLLGLECICRQLAILCDTLMHSPRFQKVPPNKQAAGKGQTNGAD